MQEKANSLNRGGNRLKKVKIYIYKYFNTRIPQNQMSDKRVKYQVLQGHIPFCVRKT